MNYNGREKEVNRESKTGHGDGIPQNREPGETGIGTT